LSPVAANTLGTLLQATGDLRLAREWYQRAVNLDPTAAYAINNVCYDLILMQEPDAVTTCERAVRAAPKASAPRNNLALAYAAAGRMDKAVEQFREAGDPSTARYNIGILLMAKRDYRAAAREFGAALQMNPEFTLAATRARQARLAADVGQGTR
jgi:Flp pilus assembly protein TadD